jgi:hypothetical protein
MFTEADRTNLASGWRVWNDEDDRAVLAYRPDRFDGSAFEAACMPHLYVTRGRRSRRPEGSRNLPPDAPWTVTLYLEPAVNADPSFHDDPAAAVEAALRTAERFADGEIDYRSLYQVPRDRYLAELDRLTGREA